MASQLQKTQRMYHTAVVTSIDASAAKEFVSATNLDTLDSKHSPVAPNKHESTVSLGDIGRNERTPAQTALDMQNEMLKQKCQGFYSPNST